MREALRDLAPGFSLARSTIAAAAAGWGMCHCGGDISGVLGRDNGPAGDFAPPTVNLADSSPGPVPPPTQVGGYELGPPVATAVGPPQPDAGGAGILGCDTILGIVRDFKAWQPATQTGHPDFEHYTGDGLKGIVKDALGPDQKPVYASTGPTAMTTGPDDFNQWYRNTDGINLPYYLYFHLVATGHVFAFQSTPFFPVDWTGWGNEGRAHNFHFTTEVHTQFAYFGGETFSFAGDDDLWVFVNGKLAIDLGGTHPSQTGQVDLDAVAPVFGLVRGATYDLDLFHAERHTDTSNFQMQTNIQFVKCGIIVPEPR
jgi:fibro-slime domain-containing protein